MRVSIILLILLLFGCSAHYGSDRNRAIKVYSGGTILTMTDHQPTAEAVAVKDGEIVAVGSELDVVKAVGSEFVREDLKGRTLLPGFVDSHGHAYMMGLQASTANLLPPPDGKGRDIPTLISLLKDWKKENAEVVERVGWIAGFGYDNSQLAEGQHPTRDDLDKVSKDLPVLIIHQSGHLGVGNSKALEIAGITSNTKDPKGGVFRRRVGSTEPNGVAEEYAFFQLIGALARNFDEEVNEILVERGTALAASFGYTTVQEGRAIGSGLKAMKAVSERGALKVDLVAFPDVLEVKDIQPSRQYRNHFRIGGAKLTIDGSPQGKTAWLTKPYHVVPEGQKSSYSGYAAISTKTTNEAVQKAFQNNWPILVHANGDAAIDAMIEAVSRAQKKYLTTDNRPVLIHGQTLRKDQVPELKRLGIFPSLFPMHTFYWGDYHVASVLGPERGRNISPTAWVLESGMKFGTHHDAPVALPDSMRVLSATVTRRSRSGKVIGPEHKVAVRTALKAMTIWPAWQHFEEDSKGSIEVGKLADFVILSENPEAVNEDELSRIKVMETVKEGVSVYKRPNQVGSVSAAMFGISSTESAQRHKIHARGDGCFSGLDAMVQALNQPR